MKHDELQEDLAQHLRGNTDRMVWTNTQLGPVASPRPDLFTIDKSFARFAADAYEIKISVSDLRRDVTSGKWQSYRKYAHRVWFAFPRGLVPLDEIPRECGVICRSDKGWRAARKPVAQVLDTLPREAWIKLLIEAFPRDVFGRELQPRSGNDWLLVQAARRKFGDEVADLLRSRQAADGAYERAIEGRRSAAAEIEAEVRQLRESASERERQVMNRLAENMKELGTTLGMAYDDITPETLSAKLGQLAWDLRRGGLSDAIKTLTKMQQIVAGEAQPA